MIFISHNYQDKGIVEPIAIKLTDAFGEANVFYDSWSMQPGDSIIEKMNKGLQECNLFLFFVSKNSLRSNMVKLEWQNAVIRAVKGELKFIPVRLDESELPTILLQNMYIDLYTNGIDVAVRQIIDVASGKNTFRRQADEFSNLRAYACREQKKIVVECRAEHYMEPISNFLFIVRNENDEIDVICKSSPMVSRSFTKNVTGPGLNGFCISIDKATTPGFPFVVQFTQKMEAQIDLVSVMHEKEKGLWRPIPLIWKAIGD